MNMYITCNVNGYVVANLAKRSICRINSQYVRVLCDLTNIPEFESQNTLIKLNHWINPQVHKSYPTTS